jgi:hypothetical protein
MSAEGVRMFSKIFWTKPTKPKYPVVSGGDKILALIREHVRTTHSPEYVPDWRCDVLYLWGVEFRKGDSRYGLSQFRAHESSLSFVFGMDSLAIWHPSYCEYIGGDFIIQSASRVSYDYWYWPSVAPDIRWRSQKVDLTCDGTKVTVTSPNHANPLPRLGRHFDFLSIFRNVDVRAPAVRFVRPFREWAD